MFSIATAKKFAANQLELGTDAIDTFKINLRNNPVYAFTWADAAMKGAAQVEVATTLMRHLDSEKVSIEHLNEYAMDRALYGAANPPRSTSVCSNEMERYVCAVWAELARKATNL